ncbi:MAG TPA: helix-turn-helix domain-containing protein [Gaiellaceae bacterium]|nr:helix-turn-helix domain-containing protein [Gaiellaceae bacterium]
MKASYGHFCLAARTLETVGDRWSLLIVRDLLAGPRRFGDLRRLLTNVTPKWLTIRLRQLESAGIVKREQQPGRREVWYELTGKGRDLEPVLEALIAWGHKHERHPLGEDEAAHPEHLIGGAAVALNNRAPKPSRRRAWRFEFGDGERSLALVFDGERWSVADRDVPSDVVVSTTARAWADFITRPFARRRLPSREIRVSGPADRVAELVKTFGAAPGDR